MSAVLENSPIDQHAAESEPVVIVGTGPVGIRVAEELLRRNPDSHLVIYGNEPWEPYNRVRLSSLLTGEVDFPGIQNPVKLPEQHRVVQHHNCEIIGIDRENRCVIDRLGRRQHWSKLVLATGSRARVPTIQGIEKTGVYTFRNLDDAQHLLARRARSRRAVVLGGGLLGLEAARGLQKFHTEVYVLEHADRLMASQLDRESADLLREQMLSEGIQVICGDSVKTVLGDPKLTGLLLRSGRELNCDTLLVATGIQPNIQLARDAGLAVGRGIRVNDHMQTGDPDIFAVGECAEHRDRIFGLVGPGLEQAGVAAHCIEGGTSSYSGSLAATRLKVSGVSLFSMGRTGENEPVTSFRSLRYRSADNRVYRKLLLHRNRLVGAIGYGDWAETNRVQEALQHRRILWPWQQSRFLRSGFVWPESDAVSVTDWPAASVVCQCTGVCRGRLSQAIAAGHASVEALSGATGAGQVCGGCKPLLAELAGQADVAPEPGSRTLVWSGAFGLLLALAFLLFPAIPFTDTVQTGLRWDQLWSDSLAKQITGFSLLGTGVLISLISLRKRIKKVSFAAFSSWRLLHVLAGCLAAFVLLAHTGLRLGDNLNLMLMLSFVGLLLVGSVAGGSIGLQHRLPRGSGKQIREISMWLHIVLLWPLPALLGFHVLKTYWF